MGKDALYLKFRPRQLDEIVGQPQLVKTLKEASIRNRFAHAYLFAGNKGCGKTTSARIAANLMTCISPSEGRVCGQCRSCKTIPQGVSMDVIELDGAKQRKVEDINALIEGATWSPQELSKKIFIIDECHQLSSTAISSLLKIVEEPPEYLIFIFCTTELQKIPDTILSRSQRHLFSKISSKEIAGRLELIAKKEKININNEGLFELAQLGRGSMRDAIGYLEQIATASANTDITEKTVYKYFGVADRKGVYDIIQSMVDENYSLLLDQINDMVVASVDTKSLLYEVAEVFRNMLVIKLQGEKTKLVDLPDHEIAKLVKFSKSVGLGQLDKLSKDFSAIEKDLTYSIHKRLVMESTLVRCTARLNLKK